MTADAAQEQSRVVVGLGAVHRLAERLDAGDDRLGRRAKPDELDRVTDPYLASLDRAGDDGAAAGDGQRILHGHAVRAVERLTRSIEDFNSVFIRLPTSDQLSFSALSVLHTLSRRGPCRLSDLVRTEQIKQPALTSAVAKLERDGLIERRPDPRDGRASMLSLTADGQSIVGRRHADRVERLRSLIDRLSTADRTRLLSIAGVLDQIVLLASEHDGKPDVRSTTKNPDVRSGK